MVDVSLRNVEKRWGDFIAVHNLNLDITDREFIVLLGLSAAGRTQ